MKKSTRIRSLLLVVSMLLATIAIAGADELPPSDSKPLSAILKSVEKQELGIITSADFDDSLWEIKVCKSSDCLKLYIDPKSGEEKHRKTDNSDDELPPANTKPLSAIVQSLEDRNQGVIKDVEFDDGLWEVELREDGRKIKLYIDPRTGETRR
ncbi:MAG: PepSY domain-containing protein [Candidatus Jettenia sp.]|nr:MAG: PepSY domain-containing protein [Candidatus Jettenia sp.]